MPFRNHKIKLNLEGNTIPNEIQTTDENTGVITTKTKPANETLPPKDYFSLKNQLKAGINLNEVNTKIIGDNPLNTQIKRNAKLENEFNENNE